MPVILPARNSLAYPAGIAPGFDPSHVAARGIGPKHGFSLVALGGTFVNVLDGNVGQSVGVGVVSGITTIGPVTVLPAGGVSGGSLAGQAAVVDASYTMAVIFVLPSLASGGVISTGTATGGSNLEVTNTGAVSARQGNSGGQNISVMTPLVANVPFFYAFSKDGSTTNIDYLVKNLQTGKVFTETKVFTATSPAASNGTIGTGNGTNIGGVACSIAAGMFAPRRISMSELIQWSADPWSFWYPQRQRYNIAAQTAGFPWWAVNNNTGVIGTGVY